MQDPAVEGLHQKAVIAVGAAEDEAVRALNAIASQGAARRQRLAIYAAVLVLILVVAGMFGRDPWKADEPYSVGMALGFAQGGDWIVPRIAGVPFVEKPPLMYWTAALTARATKDWLPFFQGAQLAVLAWVLLMLWVLKLTGDALVGRDASPLGGGLRATMWFLGTLGAVEHLHKLTADIPFTAGAILCLAALVGFVNEHSSAPSIRPVGVGGLRHRLPMTPLGSGLLLGTGIGVAFMSKGLLVPGVVGITCLLATVFPAFRSRRYAAMLAWAFLAALPWLLIWPIAFWRDSESLFILWIWDNNFGRFFGFAHLGGARGTDWNAVVALLGITFPAAWVAIAGAIAAFAHGRRRLDQIDPAIGVLALYVVIFVVTLWYSSVLRDIYLLPMLPALALLAVRARLPDALDRAWATASIFLFSAATVAIWIRWLAMVSGHGDVATFGLGKWLPLEQTLRLSVISAIAAFGLAVLWLLAVRLAAKQAAGALFMWFAGLTLMWGTLNLLLLPWVNDARSYRATFTAMDRKVPTNAECVLTDGLGESERAMLDYYTGLRQFIATSAQERSTCRALLVMDHTGDRIPAPGMPWREVWQGGRPDDHYERFRLFAR
jgi:4-amino-4-deoxy-L-arabinose transferase-like glycosyltransferase